MRCNLIGAGRLGKTLLFALNKYKIVNFFSICVKTTRNTVDIQQNLENVSFVTDVQQLPSAHITFITTPDDTLQDIVDQLAAKKTNLKNSIIVHCSGVLDSTILAPLKDLGCYIASIHPAKAFTDTCLDTEAFKDVSCVLEGDEPARIWLGKAFETMGAKIVSIQPKDKVIYHTACVIASNYLITLAACARKLMTNIHIPDDQSKAIVQKLMESSVLNLARNAEEKQALTGPLMRGDQHTIDLHLQALSSHPDYKKLYQAAALATLPLTNLTDEQQTQMTILLENRSS